MKHSDKDDFATVFVLKRLILRIPSGETKK